jgi:hypothetical protein
VLIFLVFLRLVFPYGIIALFSIIFDYLISGLIAMQNKILKGADITCMLVEVIAKQSQNIPWKISINSEQYVHDNIRRVSMDKFYEIVTGEKIAFRALCEVLPQVLDDVIETLDQESVKNSVFEELSEISPHLLKSLYLLSFSKYEGFDSLAI